MTQVLSFWERRWAKESVSVRAEREAAKRVVWARKTLRRWIPRVLESYYRPGGVYEANRRREWEARRTSSHAK